MFYTGTNYQVKESLEAIGTCVALFETREDGQFHVVSANKLFEEICDQPIVDIIDKPIDQILPRYVDQQLRKDLRICIERQEALEREMVIDRDGRSHWWRIIHSPIVSSDKRFSRVLSTCIEITDKKELELTLEQNMKRYQAVVEAAYDGIITIGSDELIKQINQSARDMFHLGDISMEGEPLDSLLPSRYRRQHKDYVAGFKQSPVMSRPMQSRAAVVGLRADGSEFPLEATISKIRVGDIVELTAVVRDISERASLIEELQKAAIQDPLTGCYNRRHLERILHREHQRAHRFGDRLSLIMFDLDHFKQVNDSYGHDCGDEVLIACVKSLTSEIRDVDVFGRWGGEEFLVLLPQTELEEALLWAERARKRISSTSVECLDKAIAITASFGVAQFHLDDEDYQMALKRVDVALYRAKSKGRDCVES